MPTKYYRCIFYLSIVFSLIGCGQMGPLYLPDQKPPIYVPHPFIKSTT